MEGVGRLRQGEHDHLEGDYHGEHAQEVQHLAKQGVHPSDVPGGHGGAHQDQGGGQDGDDHAVEHRLGEGVVAEGHALDEVLKAGVHLAGGQGEGIGFDKGVELKGVDDHRHHGQHIDHTDHSQHGGQDSLPAAFGGEFFGVNYCCTSFLRV